MSYSITQKGVFSLEKIADIKWFQECMALELGEIADRYHCDILLSATELVSIHDFYLDDLERSLKMNTDDETTSLDHFKHAAFLSFWLRRLRPIKTITFHSQYEIDAETTGEDVDQISRRQTLFASYANEICALELGLLVCLHFQMTMYDDISETSDIVKILPEAERPYVVSPLFFKEIISIFKKKNNSPYSIFLIFKSIFRA